MEDYTLTERRALCGPIETAEGRGVVAGATLRFAKVLYPNGTEAEYAWPTIARLRGLN
jgi:hypothetical protein